MQETISEQLPVARNAIAEGEKVHSDGSSVKLHERK
jgi:hypothetical protein